MNVRAWAISMLMVAAAALSACGSIGEKDFSCPGRPPGVRCMSASEVYRATHHSDVVEPTATRALGDEPQETAKGEAPQVRRASATMRGNPSRDSQERRPEPANPHPPALNVDRPLPIRTPARVMRVWIAPWEDVRGVLHGGEHAFVEIVERRWSVGERETSEPARLFSLQSPSDPTPASTKDRKPTKAAIAARPESSSDRHPTAQGESR